MLKIEKVYNMFRVAVSDPGSGHRGWSVWAENIAELHLALDHYYGATHPKAKSKCAMCRKATQKQSGVAFIWNGAKRKLVHPGLVTNKK